MKDKRRSIKDILFNEDRTVKKGVKPVGVFTCPHCKKDIIIVKIGKDTWTGKYEEK